MLSFVAETAYDRWLQFELYRFKDMALHVWHGTGGKGPDGKLPLPMSARTGNYFLPVVCLSQHSVHLYHLWLLLLSTSVRIKYC